MKGKHIERILMLLVSVLMFEGLARKFFGGAISTLLIFAKDFVVLGMLILVLMFSKRYASKMMMVYAGLFIVFLPNIANTIQHDIILAVFGIKQYFLFVGVFFFFAAFVTLETIVSLNRFLVLTSLITSAVALVQTQLPDAHWLNLSVSGENLSAFKAGGHLRVSSTFPFIAQYNYYLIFMAVPFLVEMVAIKKIPRKILYVALGLYLVCLFVSGSRTVVFAVLMILAVFFALLLMRFSSLKIMKRVAASVVIVSVLLLLGRQVFPDAFGAFEERSGGSLMSEAQMEEVSSRMEHFVVGWRYLYEQADTGPLGYGMGIMSNGVEKLSTYAATVRGTGFWGETEVANIVLEGGMYLLILVYAIRIALILYLVVAYFRSKLRIFSVIIAVCCGEAVYWCIFGNLSTQPPAAIWFWMSFGIGYCASRAEKQYRVAVTNARKNAAQQRGPGVQVESPVTT